MPKGYPNLGAQLVHLSKAERKAAKAVDPDRLARRLAKKKARNSLRIPEKGKDRVRVRKIRRNPKVQVLPLVVKRAGCVAKRA